jgi:hypothetical protein
MANIKIKQGEAKTLTLTVTDEYSRKVDLTGAALFLGIKRNKADTSYLISKEHDDFELAGVAQGQVTVLLSADDTDQSIGRLTGELKVTFLSLEIVKSDDFYLIIEEAVTS